MPKLPSEVFYHEDKFLIENFSIEYFESLTQFDALVFMGTKGNHKTQMCFL